MSDPFRLDGRCALITGGTRGIGRAIAESFAEAGARIVVSSESADDTREAAADIGATGIACNVTDEAALARLVEQSVAALGGIDILVCCAGIAGRAGDWSTDDFDAVMAVNLRAQVALTRLALPHMAGRTGANVILVASISALRGNAAINAYALAKAGVVQLARNIAVQWGPQGVRANALSPGLIDTGFSTPLLDDIAFMSRRLAMTPLRRAGHAPEVAAAARFLASDAAGFVTGHNLVVDGGTLITDGS